MKKSRGIILPQQAISLDDLGGIFHSCCPCFAPQWLSLKAVGVYLNPFSLENRQESAGRRDFLWVFLPSLVLAVGNTVGPALFMIFLCSHFWPNPLEVQNHTNKQKIIIYIYKKKALGTRHFKVSLNVGKKVCWKCFVLCVWSKMLSLPRMLRAQLFPLKQTMPVAKWHKGKLSSPCIVPLLTEVGFPPNPCTPSWRSWWWAEQRCSDSSVLPLRSSWRDSLLQLLCDLPTSSSFTVLVYVFLFLRSVKAVLLKLCFLLGRFLWSRMACHIFFFLCVK